MNIHFYCTKSGKNVILSYLDELPKGERESAFAIIKMLSDNDLNILKRLDTRQLRGKLWEIKFDQSRIMYVVVDKDNIYLLHACKKQKQKTEIFELNKAIKRAKELEMLIGKKLI